MCTISQPTEWDTAEQMTTARLPCSIPWNWGLSRQVSLGPARLMSSSLPYVIMRVSRFAFRHKYKSQIKGR